MMRVRKRQNRDREKKRGGGCHGGGGQEDDLIDAIDDNALNLHLTLEATADRRHAHNC